MYRRDSYYNMKYINLESLKQNVLMVNTIDPVCKMEHIGLGKRMRLGDKWFTAGNCHHNATTCYGGK